MGKSAPPPSQSVLFGDPVIASMPQGQLPAIPDDLVYSTVSGPDSLVPAASSPVLRFAGYTYWALGFRSNREAMGIVAYTAAGVPRQRWDRGIARYPWRITSDPSARTVTFHGQRRSDTGQPGTITMAWDELIPDPPAVSSRREAQVPPIPAGLRYRSTYGPDSIDDNPNCPVLRFGDYTYWPFSGANNESAMGIVAYDCAGNAVRQWDRAGARCLWQITLDREAQTVTFHGQRVDSTGQPGKITMSWDELWIG
jgi:hypothetical protein